MHSSKEAEWKALSCFWNLNRITSFSVVLCVLYMCLTYMYIDYHIANYENSAIKVVYA